MDSSSVLASARYRSGKPQLAYSTVYTDKTFDESRRNPADVGRRGVDVEPRARRRPHVFDLVRRMVAANDEPVATATWLSHFVLCEQVAKDGYDALFGGLGGDELNAGEYEYFFFHFADLMHAKVEPATKEIAKWARTTTTLSTERTLLSQRPYERCTDPASRALPSRREPHAALLLRTRADFFDIEQFTPSDGGAVPSYLKTRTYQDLTRETAPCCLRAEDRQTQAFGIDNHVPFFDHRLIEFMFRIPGTLKIRQGVTKILLRSAMRGILPEVTRTRVKKTGWNAPAHLWFAGEGKNRAPRPHSVTRLQGARHLRRRRGSPARGGARRDRHLGRRA